MSPKIKASAFIDLITYSSSVTPGSSHHHQHVTMGNMTVTHVLHMCYIRVTHWSWSSPIENRSLVGFWGRSVVPQVSRIISRVHRWPSAVWTITNIEAWWVNHNNYYQLFSIIIITVLCPAIWKKSFAFLGYISVSDDEDSWWNDEMIRGCSRILSPASFDNHQGW